LESPYGPSEKSNDNEFEMNVVIPANTTATIYLPAAKNFVVKENGKIIKTSNVNGRAIVKIGSGRYNFKVN